MLSHSHNRSVHKFYASPIQSVYCDANTLSHERPIPSTIFWFIYWPWLFDHIPISNPHRMLFPLSFLPLHFAKSNGITANDWKMCVVDATCDSGSNVGEWPVFLLKHFGKFTFQNAISSLSDIVIHCHIYPVSISFDARSISFHVTFFFFSLVVWWC